MTQLVWLLWYTMYCHNALLWQISCYNTHVLSEENCKEEQEEEEDST